MLLTIRKFTISPEDIKTGECGSTSRCAVAKAIARKVPGYGVSVDGQSIRFTSPGGRSTAYAKTPSKVSAFIEQFDRVDEAQDEIHARRQLKGFQFRIPAPVRPGE